MVSVTERVKTLFLQPRNAGGRGGIGGASAAAISADSHSFASLQPGEFSERRKIVVFASFSLTLLGRAGQLSSVRSGTRQLRLDALPVRSPGNLV